MAEQVGTVSSPGITNLARAVRVVSASIEAGLFLLLAGSALTFGAVHPWAQAPVWGGCLVLAVLATVRMFLVWTLRKRLGPRPFHIHPSGRWLVLEEESPYGDPVWRLDLSPTPIPPGVLLVPMLCFVGWVLLEMVPLPPSLLSLLARGVSTDRWGTLSERVPDTLRGLAFVLSAMAVHAAAAAVFERPEARDTFQRRLRWLGLCLAVIALVQAAAGTKLVYGFFQSREGSGDLKFGPFINRNHYAAYMLMVVPVCFSLLAAAYRQYAQWIGRRPNLRRRLVGLSSAPGIALIYATIPTVACVGSLIATTSRGGLIAFSGSLILAFVVLFRRTQAPAWILAAVFIATPLSWFGLERLRERFHFLVVEGDAPGRTTIWKETVSRMQGRLIAGAGFNSFGGTITRTTAWDLPIGASPWSGTETTIIGKNVGYFTLSDQWGYSWYREAHNDYLQLLAETGVPGLLLALWAISRLLSSARADPWLLMATSGLLLHEFVEFGLQVPAVALLFVTIAALCRERSQDVARPHADFKRSAPRLVHST